MEWKNTQRNLRRSPPLLSPLTAPKSTLLIHSKNENKSGQAPAGDSIHEMKYKFTNTPTFSPLDTGLDNAVSDIWGLLTLLGRLSAIVLCVLSRPQSERNWRESGAALTLYSTYTRTQGHAISSSRLTFADTWVSILDIRKGAGYLCVRVVIM